jgi:hypothetical protein
MLMETLHGFNYYLPFSQTLLSQLPFNPACTCKMHSKRLQIGEFSSLETHLKLNYAAREQKTICVFQISKHMSNGRDQTIHSACMTCPEIKTNWSSFTREWFTVPIKIG